MILVDAHAHIYDCFDIENFFESAYSNFESAAERIGRGREFTSVLLLSETSRDHWFNRLSNYAVGESLHSERKTGNWAFHKTEEEDSLYGRSSDSKELFLIAGQQIVASEGLEVLALCTIHRFADGTPMVRLLESIKKAGGIPVIPWGFGKWIGSRSNLLRTLITNTEEHNFLLGDNGGRPFLLPAPNMFRLAEKKGIKILPGSDPLPIVSEQKRVGSFGFSFYGTISKNQPAQDLKRFILDPMNQYQTFGKLENPIQFLWNQLALRLKRRCRINV
jgi:hypothetical protein